jgi:hypothetical protein
MVESPLPVSKLPLARVEPSDRLVVLARTIEAQGPDAEAALADGAANGARFGEACLGQALYRHRSVFRNAAASPVWSHLELRYFHDIVPAEAIHELVVKPQPAGVTLLRAEILLTTPSAFVLPRGWRGAAGRQTSIEYIAVQPPYLGEYRDIMRSYIGPAAAKLVEGDQIGTFRTMETAAVLHHDPALAADWNQIHICEVDAENFSGFGDAFDAALRDISPDGGFAAVFAGLDRLRIIPRWTLNDAVVEADAALGRAGAG